MGLHMSAGTRVLGAYIGRVFKCGPRVEKRSRERVTGSWQPAGGDVGRREKGGRQAGAVPTAWPVWPGCWIGA